MSIFTSGEKLELAYWNGRGLMEVPRMLLALAGKFPGDDYKDGRYSSPTEPGDLSWNLGRMPLLRAGSESVGQSAAINFYVASECGLNGSNNMQAAQILSISEHLKEMKQKYGTLAPYGVEPTTEVLDSWFDTGATDASPAPADGSARDTRFLGWWMGRIEAVVGSGGIAVGDKISLADVLIYNTFAEHLKDDEAAEGVAKFRREPFGSKARTDAALEKHPKLKAICESVAANESIQKWLGSRGVQGF